MTPQALSVNPFETDSWSTVSHGKELAVVLQVKKNSYREAFINIGRTKLTQYFIKTKFFYDLTQSVKYKLYSSIISERFPT